MGIPVLERLQLEVPVQRLKSLRGIVHFARWGRFEELAEGAFDLSCGRLLGYPQDGLNRFQGCSPPVRLLFLPRIEEHIFLSHIILYPKSTKINDSELKDY